MSLGRRTPTQSCTSHQLERETDICSDSGLRRMVPLRDPLRDRALRSIEPPPAHVS